MPNDEAELDKARLEADIELVMSLAAPSLGQVSDYLSPEAICSIADFIRFVNEREEREQEGDRGSRTGYC